MCNGINQRDEELILKFNKDQSKLDFNLEGDIVSDKIGNSIDYTRVIGFNEDGESGLKKVEQVEEVCIWIVNDMSCDETEYHLRCKNSFHHLEEYNFIPVYCPYCGKPIKIKE